MTPYSDQGLEALMADLESDLVERNRSGADRTGIRRNICAVANDLPGVIVIIPNFLPRNSASPVRGSEAWWMSGGGPGF
jgi:hypothetical protein